MTIYAQFGGTVLEKNMLPGAYIMPGDKLFTLSDLSSVWVYADVYESDIAAVKVGQPVQATTVAYPGETFSGTITFIDPVLDDATRGVKVRIEMANPDGKLKPNMFVTLLWAYRSARASPSPSPASSTPGRARSSMWPRRKTLSSNATSPPARKPTATSRYCPACSPGKRS
jgi:hypothetical protein